MKDLVLSLHTVIVIAYFGAGVVVPLALLWHTERTIAEWVMAAGSAMFFVGCGLHHIDFIRHISDGTVIPYSAAHHFVPLLLQVVGAPIFVFTLIRGLRTFYRGERHG